MAHIHSILDKDIHFSIDPVTRLITNESLTKTAVVQYDHNSERFTFGLPRYIEDHDMSLCNRVEVHYKNINAETRAYNQGVYLVEDLQVDPENEDIVVCSWVISQNATQYVGPLEFAVHYACVTEDVVDYLWNTAAFTDFKVMAGQTSSDAVVTQYADVLQTWWKKLFMIEGGSVDENSDEALTFWVGTHAEYDALSEEEKNVENRLYFFEDDPSIETLQERIADLQSELDALSESLGGSSGESGEVMSKTVYDTDGDGVVDSAATLGGSITANMVATKDYVAQEVGTPLAELRASVGSANGVASLDEDGKIPIAQIPSDELEDTFVPRSGGAMTGYLVLHADPTEDMDAATKRYVDSIGGKLKHLKTITYSPTSDQLGTSTPGGWFGKSIVTTINEFSMTECLMHFSGLSNSNTATSNIENYLTFADSNGEVLLSGDISSSTEPFRYLKRVAVGPETSVWQIGYKNPTLKIRESISPITEITITDNYSCTTNTYHVVTIKLFGVLSGGDE